MYLFKEKRLKMDFTKFHCPVCSKNFVESDDVVVCPECGTPHHRECYNLTGRCFNEDLHGTDISADNFKNPEAEKKEEISQPKSEENTADSNGKNAENPFRINESAASEFVRFSSVQGHLIEGKHSSLFEAAVGKNQRYYIPKFTFLSSYRKKFSFNFVAFFSPLAWALYRKMYKAAALIFAIYLLIFGLSFLNVRVNSELINTGVNMVVEMEENPELYQELDVVNMMEEENFNSLSKAQKEFITALHGSSVFALLLFLVHGLFSFPLLYLPKIIFGLFGNSLYMKKLTKNISEAEKRGLVGENLMTFLYKKYGTLPLILAILVCFAEIYFLR